MRAVKVPQEIPKFSPKALMNPIISRFFGSSVNSGPSVMRAAVEYPFVTANRKVFMYANAFPSITSIPWFYAINK